MCILTQEMRDAFVRSLRQRYARELPTKHISDPADIAFGAVKLFDSGTPFRPPFSNEAQAFIREDGSPYLEETLTPLVEKIWEYFNKTPAPKTAKDFDRFHDKLCELFLSIFFEYNYSYGNAQKFVNMLFKYLACYYDSNNYTEWFRYCHMALDGYTYIGAGRTGYPLSFCRDVVFPTTPPSVPLTSAWSKLNRDEYLEIVSVIRAYMAGHPMTYNNYLSVCASFPIFTEIPPLSSETATALTPFEAEFFIWAICKACKGQTATFIRGIVATL